MDTEDVPKAPPGDGAPSILTHPDDARAMTAQMSVVNAFFSAAPRNIPRQDSGEGVASVLMSLGAREPVLCGSARTTKTSAPPVSGQIFKIENILRLGAASTRQTSRLLPTAGSIVRNNDSDLYWSREVSTDPRLSRVAQRPPCVVYDGARDGPRKWYVSASRYNAVYNRCFATAFEALQYTMSPTFLNGERVTLDARLPTRDGRFEVLSCELPAALSGRVKAADRRVAAFQETDLQIGRADGSIDASATRWHQAELSEEIDLLSEYASNATAAEAHAHAPKRQRRAPGTGTGRGVGRPKKRPEKRWRAIAAAMPPVDLRGHDGATICAPTQWERHRSLAAAARRTNGALTTNEIAALCRHGNGARGWAARLGSGAFIGALYEIRRAGEAPASR